MSKTTMLAAALASSLLAALAIASPASAASIEITDWDGGAFLQNGDPATQAGSHPSIASGGFSLARTLVANGEFEIPLEDLKDAITELPPGVIGNPQAVDSCSGVQFALGVGFCPAESQVGVLILHSLQPAGEYISYAPLFNLKPPQGTAALFGFFIAGVPVTVSAKLRTGGDYGVTATSANAQESLVVIGAEVELWGVPADPSHDTMRGACLENTGPTGKSCPSLDKEHPKAFFTLPTSCTGPIETFFEAIGWLGGADRASFLSHDNTKPIPKPIEGTGCGALDYAGPREPTLEARPTTNVADSPSGLEVDLHIPQDTFTDPNGTVEANLKDTTVTLPEGMTINPSGANGLGACSSAQVDLHGEGPAHCPDAAKLGTVEVDTPVLDHPVPGAVYIAKPFDNPFNSLLAIYIAVDDPVSGAIVKLAGKVEPDPDTGQLTTTFLDNPQLPFEDFKLKFFGGAGGTLRTPSVCGDYSTTSSLTPWSAPESGPPATPSDTWTISQGPGGSCATSEGSLPHAPSFDAGSVSPIAGTYSPFVVHLRREDGSQQFSSLSLSPPPGLVAKLAGTTYCPESALAAAAARGGAEEKASPSCPASSDVGSVTAAAGAGPAPYYATGRAYLSGPYKGAPLSLAVITPATAGPFDLGNVVVRTALYLDPETTRITAVSDPLPRILEGIPLDVRSVEISMDRPAFTLNPTSCNPMAVSGQLLSTTGQAASLLSRFQLAECTRLGFKPKLSFALKGGTERGGHPALKATLTYPQGAYANIASASVALPRSEFLDQAHIGTVCTRVQFAASACPAASVYGHVKATTPLLDAPLEGPVYLRSSNNLLPDLVFDLNGQVRVALVGRVDSIRGGIRNTFESLPDAPVSKFVLTMQGGKKGLLINSRDICAHTFRATIGFTAQNGKSFQFNPPMQANCGKKAKHKKQRSHRSRAAG